MSLAGVNPREADALASMMGADSRRIDGLAEAVGEVKGSVQALRGDMGHVSKGVDELRGAMTILSRHAVVMETVLTDISALRSAVTAMDARVKLVELDMPLLRITRDWTLRGVLMVFGVVALAVIGLVVKSGVLAS